MNFGDLWSLYKTNRQKKKHPKTHLKHGSLVGAAMCSVLKCHFYSVFEKWGQNKNQADGEVWIAMTL